MTKSPNNSRHQHQNWILPSRLALSDHGVIFPAPHERFVLLFAHFLPLVPPTTISLRSIAECASVGKALSVAWQPVIQPLVPSLLIPHSRQIIGEAYQSIAGGDLRITGLISQSIRPGRRQPHGGHVKMFSHSSLADWDCRNIIQNSRMTARRSAKQSFIELGLR
jgi:hypothetical protein